ncbi:MAG: hypothetical protein ACQKBY_12490, partial [Verrucomicrobiales bacterium]
MSTTENSRTDQEEFEENKMTPHLQPPEGSEAMRPEPLGLFADNPVDFSVLAELEGKNILEVSDFSFAQVA